MKFTDIIGQVRTLLYWSDIMNFSDYAKFLYTYISKFDKYEDYFVELMQNFIDEDKFDDEDFGDKESDTLYRYISGSRNIPQKLATKLNTKCDIDKFAAWLDDRIAESNSHEDIYKWLVENGIDNREVSTACANLLKDIINELASKCGRNSKHKKSAYTVQSNNISEYAKFINETKLPSKLDDIKNIFSFRSNKIKFQGRRNELEKLNNWLIQSHVSVWAITGQGGSGKSRLALQFANQIEDDTEKESIGKAVWIDNEVLDKLLTYNDFSYPKPVLFICDYAANYEEKLSRVVDKISRTQANAKFLLIERSDLWYSVYRQKNDVMKDHAVEEPIFLDHLDFSPEEYADIMQDFSNALFGIGVKQITEEAQNRIIQKTKELSGEKCAARCLFLLLVTDAYLRDSDISHLSAQNLLHNYFEHSRRILSRQYEDDILEAGYRVLAYATAYGGIDFSDMKNHQAIQNEWEIIKGQLKTRSKINQFFQQISEIDENDTVPAMKPDLFGEFLFLHEWNELMDEQNDWLFDLLKQDYSRSFFAMCLSDWKEESKILLDLLSDQNADAEQLVACAVVLNLAVHKVHSEEERMEYTAKIKELDNECSAAILKEYMDAISFIFKNGTNSIRSECTTWLNEINWTHYPYETDKDQSYYADACLDAGHIAIRLGEYDKALEYYNKALKIREKILRTDNIDIARSYECLGFFYAKKFEYDKALECSNKAREIYESGLGTDDLYIPLICDVTYDNIGAFYYRLGNYDKAFEYYIKALAIHEKEYETDFFNTKSTQKGIDEIKDILLSYTQEQIDKIKEILSSFYSKTQKKNDKI